LSDAKIGNDWLYVISQHMAWPTTGREALSVAPDRHVVAASNGSDLSPIDPHTPLWLWRRAGFPALAD